MKIEKYEIKSGEKKWKFRHYLGTNPYTGRKDEIERQGFNSHAEAVAILREIILVYEQNKQMINTL